MEDNETNQKQIKNCIIDKETGEHVGFLDNHNNIFCMNNCYFGTIQKKRKIFFPILFIFAIIITLTLIIIWSCLFNKIKVYEIDSKKEWNIKTNLNIFENPKYSDKKIIAPSDTGQYQFFVENITSNNIKTNIVLEDINPCKIKMKYRLKKENKYILGDETTWMPIEFMQIKEIKLKQKEIALYTLEWKLEDVPYDNLINKTAKYTLQIIVKAK